MANPSTSHLSSSDIKSGMRGDEVAAANPSKNWAELAVSVARVKEIQYEELKCSLVVLTGESDVFEYSGVDLTLPGGGRRHFFGALPERGDLCLVGWAARESAGTASSRAPVILGWVPAAPWMGHEWTPFSRYGPLEGLDIPRDRAVALGLAERVRFKLRHAGPGNVLASSSEGSDLVLDDSVLLANRRGCELVLRDSDSAFVARSVAGYAVTSGTRVYSGPVAREARLLPTSMFSDGLWWDAPIPQVNSANLPVGPDALPANPDPSGFLTPGLIFQRGLNPDGTLKSESDFLTARGGSISQSLDPFTFLGWGGFVLSSGFRGDVDDSSSRVAYGGKPLYRVGVVPDAGGLPVTGVVNALAPPGEGSPGSSLTEYRVEVAHTSDGTLPVTEQTDGFDAERLPRGFVTDASPYSLSANRAFVEWVLGSVVGNDPYSVTGRPLYGLPLKPVVFASGATAPGLVSGLGSRISEHAATLLRITPPFGAGESWASWTKAGAYRARISAGGVSAQVSLAGGTELVSGGAVSLTGGAGVLIAGNGGPGNSGVSVSSSAGTVTIYGGGVPATGVTAALDVDPNVTDGASAPSVTVGGAGPVSVESNQEVRLAAPRITLSNTASLDLRAQSAISLSSGQRLALSSQAVSVSATGGMVTTISGPADSNPANGPSRSVSINSTPATGNAGGETDSYTLTYGDRVEEITLQGSHTTTLTVGNFTFETRLGSHVIRTGTNQVSLDSDNGYDLSVLVGDASTTLTSGSLAMTIQQGVTVRALTGLVTLSGSTGVKLVSPGPANGGILCGSDTDPLTGLTYEALGLPPRNQTLAPA
jgi:hypothetical protein